MPHIKMYILSLGNMEVKLNDLITTEDTKKMSLVEIPTWALYIEHPKGKILFDTGRKNRAKLIEELSKCNVCPEDIDYVVMSHLHFDHAGNIDVFQNAKIIVQECEMKEVLENGNAEYHKGAYIMEQLSIDVNWSLISGKYPLLDGITILPFHGHTKGLQGILIHLESGYVLVCSDACYSLDNYGPPIKLPGFLKEKKDYIKSIESIRKLTSQYNAKILFGHDEKQFKSLKTAPFFYE